MNQNGNRNRRQARLYAFQTIFANEFTDPAEHIAIPDEDSTTANRDRAYAQLLIDGVFSKRQAIDEILQAHSPKRTIARMGAAERNILRLAIFEMMFAPEKLDPRIVINEAITLAKEFGTEKGYMFVNGVLDAVAKKGVTVTV